jgi:hypothetical protein
MSSTNRLADQDANPYAPPRAPIKPKVHALSPDQRRRVRRIRIIALVYFGIALFFLGLDLTLLEISWEYPHAPEQWTSIVVGHSVLLLISSINTAIGVGAWALRRWPIPLALAEGLCVLAWGFYLAAVAVYVHERDSSFMVMVIGLFLVLLPIGLWHLLTHSDLGSAKATLEEFNPGRVVPQRGHATQ